MQSKAQTVVMLLCTLALVNLSSGVSGVINHWSEINHNFITKELNWINENQNQTD